MDNTTQQLRDRIEALRLVADIIEEQLPYQNEIWMKSILKLGIGRDARAFVDDIQWLEAKGHTRSTTWARNKKESQRSKHTMGYQIRGSASKFLF